MPWGWPEEWGCAPGEGPRLLKPRMLPWTDRRQTPRPRQPSGALRPWRLLEAGQCLVAHSSSPGLCVPRIYPQSHGVPGGACGVPILVPSRAVYRGQPGCPCLLVNGFYFCTDGRVACCMYCVSSGPPLHPHTPPCPVPVPLLLPGAPLALLPASPSRGSAACPGTWGAGFGTCPLLGSRHGADAAPRLSNKRILSQRWMPLFMGLGAGIWLCPRLGWDGGAVRPGGRLWG